MNNKVKINFSFFLSIYRRQKKQKKERLKEKEDWKKEKREIQNHHLLHIEI